MDRSRHSGITTNRRGPRCAGPLFRTIPLNAGTAGAEKLSVLEVYADAALRAHRLMRLRTINRIAPPSTLSTASSSFPDSWTHEGMLDLHPGSEEMTTMVSHSWAVLSTHL